MQQPSSGRGREEPPDPEALAKALRFIDYRPRSTGETSARLRKAGYSEDESREVTDYLEVVGILNDREFSRLFMEELIRKGLGAYKVRSELLKKKLPRDLVEETMAAYPADDEVDRALETARKRFRQLDDEDERQARRKICDYLVRRGYSRQASQTACRLLTQFDTESGPELE